MIHPIQSSTAVQILLIAWQTRTPFQRDRISATLLGIIQSTPNNKNTNDYNSLLKAQYKRRQSTVSLLFLYIYHYFKKIIVFFFLGLSTINTVPKAAVHPKNATVCGILHTKCSYWKNLNAYLLSNPCKK